MSKPDIADAKYEDQRASFAALRRAAAMARTTAIQTGTGIVISRDGKPVFISAAELWKGQR